MAKLPAKIPESVPVLTAEVVSDVAITRDKAAKIKAAAAAIKITDDEDEARKATYLKAIHEELKALEAKRIAIADPLTKAKKAVDDLFRGPKQDLEIAKGAISLALGAYAEEKRARTAALLAKSTEEAQTPEERRALIVAASNEAPTPKGTREVVTYMVRVTDASKIAREFLMPDVSKAQDVIESSEGTVCPTGFAFEKVVKSVPTGK